MNRGLVWTAALSGVALVGVLTSSYTARAADRRALDEVRERLTALDEAARTPAPPAAMPVSDDAAKDETELRLALASLEARVVLLESRAERESLARRDEEREAKPSELADTEAGSAAKPTDADVRELDSLLERLAHANWDYSGLGAEYERFLQLARKSGMLDARIAELEERIKDNPNDADARMQLADHYVGKLMTVSGPEQGLWGGRAETQWQSVVDLDDGHWRAHAALGVNYSYYPEVLGKRSDALRHLERALEIQRASAPEPGHVQTYVYLARLRAQAGEVARAREILNEGLARHPGDPTLESALSELGS